MILPSQSAHENTIVSILAEVETETHCYQYREDGSLNLVIDPEKLLVAGEEVPGYMRKAVLQPGGTIIPREDRGVLRRLLDEADEIEAS